MGNTGTPEERDLLQYVELTWTKLAARIQRQQG